MQQCNEINKVIKYNGYYIYELKIKTESYLKLLTTEMMAFLGSTESKITQDKNGENVPHLEITEVVLAHCDFISKDYQQDSRVLYTFVPNKWSIIR